MSNDISSTIQLFAVILLATTCYRRLDIALKGGLNQLLAWLVKQTTKWLPLIFKKLKKEFRELNNARQAPSKKQEVFFAWSSICTDVLFAGHMAILAIVFLGTAYEIQDNGFKFILAIGTSVLFLFISWIYASFAHKTANKYGINKYPWRKQTI